MPRTRLVSNERGFTLIELLIVVAIIGIVAAIAIPNMLNSLDRSRQKRTMGDMRTLATILEEYSIDNNFYPIQAPQGLLSTTVGTAITPTYSRFVPTLDGWSRDFHYGTTSDGYAYTIRSYGKDGILNGAAGQTSNFDCDIIVQGGQFTAWPEGIQT